MKVYTNIVTFFLIALGMTNVYGANENGVLPLPRFVTIKASEANTRTGPSVRYPIRFSYQRANLPVEIIAEVDQWRKIRDFDRDEGWIHQSLLSGRRSVIIIGKELQVIFEEPDIHSKPIIRLEPGVIAKLLKCSKLWCYIEAGDEKGWVERVHLWGVYPTERFKD